MGRRLTLLKENKTGFLYSVFLFEKTQVASGSFSFLKRKRS